MLEPITVSNDKEMLKILKNDKKVILKSKGSNSAYIKNNNILYISPLKVPKGSVYVKVSLTLSQNRRNNSIFKQVHVFWDTL